MSLETFEYLALGAVVVWLVNRIHYVYFTLTDIPTVGPSGFFTTFFAMKRYLKAPEEFLQEGYSKFPNVAFKLYTMDGWIVVASGEDRVADLRKVRDDVLSFGHSMEDLTQMKFTFGKELQWDLHNTDFTKLVTSTSLTRSIPDKFGEIRDEIIEAIEENIPASEADWVPVTALPAMVNIVSRAANRMLLGSSFSKNPEFLNLTTEFTLNVVKGFSTLHIFPEICRPIIAKKICRTESYYKRALKFLEPTLRYRLSQEMKFGSEWDGKPNDSISWFLAVMPEEKRTIRELTFRMLGISFANLHTTSQTLSHTLFDLAANPQYAQPLREEIEVVIEKYGWSYASMQRMKRLDSFIKESQRLWGISPITSSRRVLKPFTFSNGQIIPPGFEVVVPAKAIHLDKSNYENPREFRPFRFSDMDLDSVEEEVESDTRSFVAISKTFTLFGAPGRHNCPGRFFAATEIKLVMAYLVINFDMRFKNGKRPENHVLGPALSANETAQVLFKKRRPRC
ncbi:cytochrome P450 [Flagelloscypha sp. PMI_526]|nr:cytochrome P450 [Flagelloscypha sp. PMI_526]